ncbi:phosphotransferase [Paenibacillus cremeus]|uniref:Phosphotransferase n=1 Tax=Paenibacillus cremeus TaxID=2163881 RepID=A0A559JRE1_9BACL|nr:phosphotransferase [Paenibacillus cremeus]TVY02430.1 phosphotransferase [Paenibacillus cremeus]
MTRFLNGHQVAPEVVAYETDAEHDYLLTEAVAGEDGVSGVHLENPTLLAIAFGEHLRRLHSLPVDNCPYPHRTAEMIGAGTSFARTSTSFACMID